MVAHTEAVGPQRLRDPVRPRLELAVGEDLCCPADDDGWAVGSGRRVRGGELEHAATVPPPTDVIPPKHLDR